MHTTFYRKGPAGSLHLDFHPGQERAWDSTARFICVLSGTQGGKTTFYGLRFSHRSTTAFFGCAMDSESMEAASYKVAWLDEARQMKRYSTIRISKSTSSYGTFISFSQPRSAKYRGFGNFMLNTLTFRNRYDILILQNTRVAIFANINYSATYEGWFSKKWVMPFF